MPNTTLAANAPTVSNREKLFHTAFRAFRCAYSEWLMARAAAEGEFENDADGVAAAERREAAERALIAAPAPDKESLLYKFELLDALISEQALVGDRKYPIVALAAAALRCDAGAIDQNEWR